MVKLKKEIPAPKSKIQHLFRLDRVEQKKKEGWKLIGPEKNRKQVPESDLVLMEK